MEQKSNYADSRLINDCIYCGGAATTREHVPSRVFLDRPYPNNLPVVGACKSCNQGFSLDEQYLICLFEAIITGSADPKKMRRETVAKALKRSPALRTRIESATKIDGNNIIFDVEESRIKNVLLKVARGHAAYELSQPCPREPTYFWWGPLNILSETEREQFNMPHVQQMLSEIGSRNIQRMQVIEILLQSEDGKKVTQGLVLNDWIDVQDGYYRFLAIDDIGGVVVRMVISEYFACEVLWKV
ncbi:hypothetical protein [Emcibacter sp.]|uniref:hypothetical protein n=1 Tax=Emcibacter sp. TaxID=1979954 RepID=UPI002AA65A24|nr:hypothetical protein [Emcibacter sp.]